MEKLRILKLGDELYSQSLQKVAPVYHRAFPQRETQLYGRLQDVELIRLTHQQLLAGETHASVAEQVSAYLSRQRFDLILLDNPLSILALDVRVDVPIVFDCIDWYEEMYAAEFNDAAGAALIRSSFDECVRRTRAVVAQSSLMLEEVWSRVRPAYSLVLPNGFDGELFRPFSEAEVEEARRQLEEAHGVSLRGRRVIVYTGKIGDWYRGLANLIEGLDASRDILFLVGDGPLLPRLPRRPNVVSVGAVPLGQVPVYTNAADILAFPLGVDCSPIVLSEYLAVGKPVVAPRGRIEWLVRDGVGGAVVDDTPDGWRLGIERATHLTGSAAAANIRLSKRLSWQELASRLDAFLHRVATPKEGAA